MIHLRLENRQDWRDAIHDAWVVLLCLAAVAAYVMADDIVAWIWRIEP